MNEQSPNQKAANDNRNVTNDDQNSLCVFRSYEECLNNRYCCRVFLNEEFMCLGKRTLLRDYNKMLTANFGESRTAEEVKVQVEDGNEEIDFCPKWIEANDVFFADTTLKYSCECAKHDGVLFTQVVFLVAIILAV